jgi:hypothetical protein
MSLSPQEQVVAWLVEVLCNKPKGHGFDSRWCHWIFFTYLIILAAMAPGLTQPLTEMSAMNLPGGVKCGQCVMVTTSHHTPYIRPVSHSRPVKEFSSIQWSTFYLVKKCAFRKLRNLLKWPIWSDTASNLQLITCTPPDGWWIIIRALGRACLIPGAPAAKSRLAMLHAWPTHHVAMGGRMYCMVS